MACAQDQNMRATTVHSRAVDDRMRTCWDCGIVCPVALCVSFVQDNKKIWLTKEHTCSGSCWLAS